MTYSEQFLTFIFLFLYPFFVSLKKNHISTRKIVEIVWSTAKIVVILWRDHHAKIEGVQRT